MTCPVPLERPSSLASRTRRGAATLLLTAALACQPTPDAPLERPTCPEMPLAAGQVMVGPLVCAAQRLTGGDGRAEDWWLANSALRAVMRHPNASLTLAGLGGGTLIDASTWTRPDELLEVSALVDGGWLSVDVAEVEEGAIRLEGALRALPYRAIPDEGARRVVRWRIEPDEPWIHLDGGHGLWIHPNDDLLLLDGWLVGDRLVYGHNGGVVEDLGGAIVTDATALLIADVGTAWAQRPGPHQQLSGTAPEADGLRLYRGATWVGVLVPAADGTFSATVPADVDGVTAHAASRAPSALTPVSPDMTLALGPEGNLDVSLSGVDRPVAASWAARDGRTGKVVFPPEGGSLPVGAGVYELTLSAGPAWTPRVLDVEVAPGTRSWVATRLERRIDAGSWVLADLDWSSNRDRGVRDDVNDRMSVAVSEGLDYVVNVARDDVATASAWLDDQQFIRWSTGTTLTSPDGWTITSWPWADSPRQSGHGAPRIAGFDPRTALQLAWGGAGANRELLVDLPWLAAVRDEPWSVAPRPTHVKLGPPGAAPFGAWFPWFTWLDAQRFVLPAGDRVWLDVRTPDRYGPVELDRAVQLGRISAGTGALLTLTLDGAGPGEVLPPALLQRDSGGDTGPWLPAPRQATLRLQRGGTSVDRLTLFTAGRGVVQTWEPQLDDQTFTAELQPGTWTIAVGWSPGSADWVVTAPIWDVLPADRPEPSDTDPPEDTDATPSP